MNLSLDEKRKNRFLLLRKLYEMTDGVPEQHVIDIREVGEELGMDGNVALETFEYLKGEGLTKWMAIGGFGTITHWGVKEVEDALGERPTAHFPANIVILSNSPGANVVSGSGHQFGPGSSAINQHGQRASYQYNAAGSIDLSAVHDNVDLVSQLDLLKQELARAREGQVISELVESKTKTALLEAIEEVKKTKPDKKSLLDYLRNAVDCLKDVAAVVGIVEAITKACQWAERTLK